MKIDCALTINTLQGVPFKDAEGRDLRLGDVIAEALATDQAGGKMKLFALAQRAYTADSMDVDAADLSMIKKSVENCKSYGASNLILGQALVLLEEVK